MNNNNNNNNNNISVSNTCADVLLRTAHTYLVDNIGH